MSVTESQLHYHSVWVHAYKIIDQTFPENGAIPVALMTFRVIMYRVILSVLDPRKCEYLKDYSLDFEHAYMITYLAS